MASLFYSNREIPASAIEWKRPKVWIRDYNFFWNRFRHKERVLKRKDICESPKMVTGGTSRHDVCQVSNWDFFSDLENYCVLKFGFSGSGIQGSLGNCWFVAACSVLAEFSNLRDAVIPDIVGQEFDSGGGYGGVFHFRFFRFGEWIDVVVDDRLPTRAGKLLFIKSLDQDEYWSALLEKAYAKSVWRFFFQSQRLIPKCGWI